MIQINNKNNPTDIELNFNKWVKRFNIFNLPLMDEFITDIQKNNTIKINFSDEIKYKEYGLYNLDQIKEFIIKNFQINNDLKHSICSLDNITNLKVNINRIKNEISKTNVIDNHIFDELIANIKYIKILLMIIINQQLHYIIIQCH